MGNSPTNVLVDPEFHGLPLAEKHKVLMATDADYRGLPPSEQAQALDHIHYDPQYGPNKGNEPTGGDKGTWSTIKSDIKGMWPESPDAMHKRIHAMPTNQLRESMRQMPYSDIASTEEANYRERREAGHGLPYSLGATAVEASTPTNVRGMEEAAESGHPGEVLGHAAAGAGTVASMEAASQLPLKEGTARLLRKPDNSLRALVKPASRVGGALAGGAAGASTHIPEAGWIGAGAGAAYGPKVAEATIPLRAEMEAPVASEAEREGQAEALRLKDQIAREDAQEKLAKLDAKKQAAKEKAQAKSESVKPGEVTVLPVGSEKGRGPLTPEQVPGKPQLRRLARGGDPRAGQELVRRGEKVLYVPEEYGGPREKVSLRDAVSSSDTTEKPTSVPRKAKNLSKTKAPSESRTPSEKVQALSEKPKDLGPEWKAGQRTHEIERNKAIIRNPKATKEDIKVAKSRLREAMSETD